MMISKYFLLPSLVFSFVMCLMLASSQACPPPPSISSSSFSDGETYEKSKDSAGVIDSDFGDSSFIVPEEENQFVTGGWEDYCYDELTDLSSVEYLDPLDEDNIHHLQNDTSSLDLHFYNMPDVDEFSIGTIDKPVGEITREDIRRRMVKFQRR
jgi:hypothetical protein